MFEAQICARPCPASVRFFFPLSPAPERKINVRQFERKTNKASAQPKRLTPSLPAYSWQPGDFSPSIVVPSCSPFHLASYSPRLDGKNISGNATQGWLRALVIENRRCDIAEPHDGGESSPKRHRCHAHRKPTSQISRFFYLKKKTGAGPRTSVLGILRRIHALVWGEREIIHSRHRRHRHRRLLRDPLHRTRLDLVWRCWHRRLQEALLLLSTPCRLLVVLVVAEVVD